MNILIPDSWLREYIDTNATVSEIKECLSLCGPSVEKIDKISNDYIYNIEITSNRIDSVSVYGIARELVAILPQFGIKSILKKIVVPNISDKSSKILPLKVLDPDKLCNRILALVLDNIEITNSIELVQNRLIRSGLRPLNNVIDITNYVMLETGYPCHVFDYDRIKTNTMFLRYAKTNEKIVTLDNKQYNLSSSDVVIDDSTGRIIDLPGIMGCANSVVTSKTKRIVLFIEANHPLKIRHTSLKHGIRTLAASINEKNPDIYTAEITFKKAVDYLKKWASAKCASKYIDIFPSKPQIPSIKVSIKYINNKIGQQINKDKIIEYLESLNFSVECNGDIISVIPPTYRFNDIKTKDDILEEVSRIYGYFKLPPVIMSGKIPQKTKSVLNIENNIKNALKYSNFNEIYTYSFISRKLIQKSFLDINNHLKLTNPLTEDTEFMRISLIPSMLEVFSLNQKYQEILSLFEIANIYRRQINSLPIENKRLLIATNKSLDYLKSIISIIISETGLNNYSVNYSLNNSIFMIPERNADISIKGKVILNYGILNEALKKSFKIEKDIFLCDINYDLLIENYQPVKKYIPLSIYPQANEQLTLITNKINSVIDINNVIESIKNISKIITKIEFLETYNDQLNLRLTYHNPNSTLKNKEIKELRNKILKHIEVKFGLILKNN
jgi:phenylalanyl-tRNA synthetase beta chain